MRNAEFLKNIVSKIIPEFRLQAQMYIAWMSISELLDVKWSADGFL